MMKRTKMLAVLAVTGTMLLGSVMTAAAADVTENETTTAQTQISVVKENPAPVFSVGIPASVVIKDENPAPLTFTMNEDSLNAIPDGKKVSVSIADAGYGTVNQKFAVYSEEAASEAGYGVFPSKYSLRDSDRYAMGQLLVSFYGNEKVTDGQASVGRVIKMDNFADMAAGNYEGYLTFKIDVRAK